MASVMEQELARLEVPLGRYQGLYHGLRVVEDADCAFEYVTSALPSEEGITHKVRHCVVDGFYSEPRALCVVQAGAWLIQLDVDLRSRTITETARKRAIGKSEKRPRTLVWDYGEDGRARGNALVSLSTPRPTWSADRLAEAASESAVIAKKLLATMHTAQLYLGSGAVRRELPDGEHDLLRGCSDWTSIDSCSALALPIFSGKDGPRTIHYRNYITRLCMTYDPDTSTVISTWVPF